MQPPCKYQLARQAKLTLQVESTTENADREPVRSSTGNFKAITDVNLPIYAQKITAIIGPSGCGKSTLLRAFNRMNDLVSGLAGRGPGLPG